MSAEEVKSLRKFKLQTRLSEEERYSELDETKEFITNVVDFSFDMSLKSIKFSLGVSAISFFVILFNANRRIVAEDEQTNLTKKWKKEDAEEKIF